MTENDSPPRSPDLPPLYEWGLPEPPKARYPVLNLAAMTRGSLFFDGDVARQLAEALVRAHCGEDELKRQLPLTVTDQGDCWRVEGSHNRDRAIEMEGWAYLTVWKYDGRVLDFGVHTVIRPHQSVMPLPRSRPPKKPG